LRGAIPIREALQENRLAATPIQVLNKCRSFEITSVIIYFSVTKYRIMKRSLLLCFFLLLGSYVLSQELSLPEFNTERLDKQRVSMLVLGGWAVGNIAVGAALYGKHEGEERYFHLMNIGWGAINLGLATVGYLTAVKTDPSSLSLYDTVRAQHGVQKILLLNAGLDVGYMLGGLYLMERSKNTEQRPERMRGFGKSIILQGAFLFAFDLAAYFVHAASNDKLQPLLSGLYFDGQQLGLVLQF